MIFRLAFMLLCFDFVFRVQAVRVKCPCSKRNSVSSVYTVGGEDSVTVGLNDLKDTAKDGWNDLKKMVEYIEESEGLEEVFELLKELSYRLLQGILKDFNPLKVYDCNGDESQKQTVNTENRKIHKINLEAFDKNYKAANMFTARTEAEEIKDEDAMLREAEEIKNEDAMLREKLAKLTELKECDDSMTIDEKKAFIKANMDAIWKIQYWMATVRVQEQNSDEKEKIRCSAQEVAKAKKEVENKLNELSKKHPEEPERC